MKRCTTPILALLTLGGIYHETIAGPETGGIFLGGWARTNCP
jgi:hypothetical protein